MYSYSTRVKDNGFCYTIYDSTTGIVVRESTEVFESRFRAELAAIGHIKLLDNGEG